MITFERLREVLVYSAETGIFTWRIRVANCVQIGQFAGFNSGGYLRIRVDGKYYFAHRLAWLYFYGRFPDHEIDHINRIKTDNRIANLREATVTENGYNKAFLSSNTSGYKGVTFHKRDNKWQAAARHKGKVIWLGYYDDPKDAAKAYSDYAKKIHGEFFAEPPNKATKGASK
jgi:hypothetical protein